MEFNVGTFVMFLMFTACLGVVSWVGYLVHRLSKDSQRQSNLMLKAMVKSTQDMRTFDTKIDLVQETGMQSLTFQKKAFDHQRILVLSMNQQLKSIQKMLSNGAENSGGNSVNMASDSVQLKRGALANNFKSQNPKIARTHIGSSEAVVRLEDLFARNFTNKPSVDVETEGAVKMPGTQNTTSQSAPQIRRIVNG